MLALLRDNAGTLRALTAVSVAIALAVVLFVQERTQIAAKERAVFAVTAASWKVSEFIFETQRLATGIELYGYGDVDKTEVELRFDLLWSRLDVLRGSELAQSEAISQLLSEVQAYLADNEVVIYDAPEIPRADVLRTAKDLDAFARRTRVLWVNVFAGKHAGDRSAELAAISEYDNTYVILAAGLILLLLIYVMAELIASNRARKKEVVLRKAAAQASEAKSRFLANVSHEIRTPLNGILGMASELGEGPLSEDQVQCLRVIEESGDLLLSTINDVLDLSRIEAGELGIERRAFVLRDVLLSARALYGALARDKGLDLTLEVAEGFPDFAVGDERRLRQVLNNLVANAVKFTEAGRVTIHANCAGEGQVAILVEDTGPGIPHDAQERIFRPFGQADTSATREHGGTGLGLAISRQLAEAMGGALTLQSAPGQGARFECRLPLPSASEEEVAAVELARKTPPPLRGRRILVVDDNATNRLILSRFLKATEADISFAETGQDALTQATESRFDVILMDIQMPVMDGVEATRLIRRLERDGGRRSSFIIAVTANVLIHQVRDYERAGMDEVLAKPVSKRKLFDVLHQLAALRAP